MSRYTLKSLYDYQELNHERMQIISYNADHFIFKSFYLLRYLFVGLKNKTHYLKQTTLYAEFYYGKTPPLITNYLFKVLVSFKTYFMRLMHIILISTLQNKKKAIDKSFL